MKRSSIIFFLLVMWVGVWIGASAQGIILPRPCPRPMPRCPRPPEVPQQPLKVKSIHIKTRITEQVAVTHVDQVFENDTPFVLEGTYFFPLPENVSITEFAMWEGGKRLVGEVRSREEARRIYDEIVRSRRDPALLEYAGKNLFQASVFPIEPHGEKRIELTYSQVLGAEAGTVAYRYPLGTGWRANPGGWEPPRPIPMQEGGPRRPAPGPGVMISGEVEIVSRIGIKGVYSPSHEIDTKRDGEGKARLSFEVRGRANPRDFELFYTLSDQEFGASLLTWREPGKDGYFLLLVSPKAVMEAGAVSAREVIFVLDTSGSMAEEGKMDKAKAALRYGVNSLDPRDRFNLISFAGEEHLLAEKPLAADAEGKRQALDFIEKMRPTGGTNINDALQAAFKQLSAGERPQMIVLITDGQPTVGETQAARIMANARQANGIQARLFTFGVGYDVNTILLDGLANENRGVVAYIEPREDIEVRVSNFFNKVNHPVLSDLKIDWGGASTELTYPRTAPDLFHGSQVVLVGRYRPGKAERHELTLTGKVNGRERSFAYKGLAFPEKATEHAFLPHLWALRRVGHLLDQIRLNGQSKELRDEIVELGTRYGIVTPYTSALVLEPGMQIGQAGRVPGSVSETVTVTVESRPLPMLAPAGRDAVLESKKKESLRRADNLEAAEAVSGADRMRTAAGKTFYLRGAVWTDSEFRAAAALPVVKLTFGSPEYFALLSREPKLADCFALGKQIVVVWNGTVFQVEGE
ncbi:MAG: VIT and VWA domain-containing protein [Blastocatellia bacterium]|nr:VIT and VWA domain-containing protein [Blastocatellia bacterium]